jgi:hypothetical protein
MQKNKPKMELIPALNTLGKKVNKWYPDINSGGCCVYAVIVAEELLSRGRKPEIVVGNLGQPIIKIGQARNNVVNRNSMAEWGSAGVHFNHVGVTFRHKGVWFVYDSDGVNPLKIGRIGRYRLYPGRMTVEEARLVAADAGGWNKSFNRKCVPKLRLRVKEFLETNLN